MVTLIRKNIRLVGYGKLMALFVGCLAFSIGNRVGDALTFEQHILSVASDHHYLTYFLIPMVLFSCFSFVEDDSETVIMRFHNYSSYFFKKWIGAGTIAFAFLSIQCVVFFASGIGLSTGNNWLIQSNTTVTDLYSVFQIYFKSPLLAFAACMIVQYLGTWFLIGLCMWISHFTSRKWSVWILMLLYVIAAIWIKLPFLRNLPITGLNHLLILHHNLGNDYRATVTGVTVMVLSSAIVITIRYMWRSHLSVKLNLHQGIVPYYIRSLVSKRNFLILCSVVVGMILYKVLKNGDSLTAEEFVVYLFAGHGTGIFHVLSFLEMLIINSTPLYLLAAFIERAVSGQSMFISVRVGGRKKLLFSIIIAGASFIFLYCLIWFVTSVVGICIYSNTLSENAFFMLLYSVALKLGDILVQYAIMLVFYILTKQVTIGFLILLAGNLLCVLPLECIQYLPFGLSSLMRIEVDGITIGISGMVAFSIFIMIMSVLFILLWKIGSRKILE